MKLLEIPYVINQGLVRGLDYYTRTVFEVTSEHLGSQKAVAAGGRYDRLVEEFGGPKTPAIGFAMGMERLVTLLKEKGGIAVPTPYLFIAALGKKAVQEALLISVRLRAKGLWVEVEYGGSSLKSQLRKADRLSAAFVFIIGDDELSTGSLKWKNMKDGSQGEVAFGKVDEFTDSLVPGSSPQ
jgi:histidyl-tRNA synthetase